MTADNGNRDSVAATTQTLPPALAVRGLTAGYEDTTILHDVSLTVPQRSVVALLGPNGAGKSTLLRTISGFLAADSGGIEMGGHDMTLSPPSHRAGAGLCHVPEGRGIFRGLTVRENLMIQCRPGDEKQGIERAVAAFPILGKRLKQQAGTLSGGEQQMLALSAAHVRETELILVDEPSLGLAPIIVDEIFAFLKASAEEGAAILLVDQFATRPLALAGAAHVMRKGQIVFSGTSSELGDSDVFANYLGELGDAS
jgi:branched-chain amino acid transport system ATP-binding protein